MFVKAFGLFVGMFGYFVLVALGGWVVFKADRLPAGWPNYRVTVIPFVHPTIHLPFVGAISVARAQRDAALANLTVCHGNVSTLQGAIRAQNAAVLALQARGDAMSRSAQTAVQRARVASQRANDLAAKILAEKVQPGDAAAQCKQAESILREVAP